ncbi:MAG: HAMP domain-containing histidine kinase [Caldilineales bacterium]|nr:HAMP domain-containing histidine kinase [Caldilineales bacterium]
MSLRLRLTLWYTGLLAVLLLLISVMAVSQARSNVQANIDNDLRITGDQVIRLLQIGSTSGPLAGVLLPAIGGSFETEVYVQVRNTEKRLVYRSNNLSDKIIPFPEEYYKAAEAGGRGYYSLSINRPDDLRVYYAPIDFGGEFIGAVQVGRVLSTEQMIVNQLATNLFWIIAVVLALGAGVGYWLAGVALRPIKEATATALAITRTGRLDARVPVTGQRNDEVGTLVNTFNEMLGRLQELFDKQRRFSGDISHELRSPLTTILGNVSLLKRGRALPPDEQAEMLEEIESESEHMRRLISDLLLLAQADADLVLTREPVELDTLLLDAYRQAKRRAGEREIHLLHEDQAIVMGDAERLRQVLVNLINNAIQYTPPDGHIDLSLTCLSDFAEIVVADTGQGISAEDLPHIFDRFYRADKARTRVVGGTGLGLSIVKWVVDAHWGDIEVESELGVGTTFRVRLPLSAGCGDNKPPIDEDAPDVVQA